MPISGIEICVVGQEFEQESLELVVGAVDLVDEQDACRSVSQRLQQRPLDQEIVGIEIFRLARNLGLANGKQLARIVPFVEGLGGIDALVALQPYQVALQRPRQRLGGLGLADAGHALDQQRLAQRKRQIGGDGETFIGEIIGAAKRRRKNLRRIERRLQTTHPFK